MSILKQHLSEHPEAVILVNCFSGTSSELEDYLALSRNLYIIITGLIASDDRGSHLREAIKSIPSDRLVSYSPYVPNFQLLASDAPHLTPFNMPKPWPRRNEPGTH